MRPFGFRFTGMLRRYSRLRCYQLSVGWFGVVTLPGIGRNVLVSGLLSRGSACMALGHTPTACGSYVTT